MISPSKIDWFKGNIIYTKIPYFMGISMVSCRFSLKSSTRWHGKFVELTIQTFFKVHCGAEKTRGSFHLAGVQRSFNRSTVQVDQVDRSLQVPGKVMEICVCMIIDVWVYIYIYMILYNIIMYIYILYKWYSGLYTLYDTIHTIHTVYPLYTHSGELHHCGHFEGLRWSECSMLSSFVCSNTRCRVSDPTLILLCLLRKLNGRSLRGLDDWKHVCLGIGLVDGCICDHFGEHDAGHDLAGTTIRTSVSCWPNRMAYLLTKNVDLKISLLQYDLETTIS